MKVALLVGMLQPIFVLLIITTGASLSRAQPSCTDFSSSMGATTGELKIFGQQVVYTKLRANPLPSLNGAGKERRFIPERIFGSEITNDVFLGFNKAHPYLVLDGIRYDGGMIIIGIPGEVDRRRSPLSPGAWIQRPALRNRPNRRGGYLSDGVIIRFKLSPEAAASLKETLLNWEADWNISCAIGTCAVLKAGNLELFGGPTVLSLTLLLRLAAHGLIYAKNGLSQTFPAVVYTLNDNAPEKTVNGRAVACEAVCIAAAPYGIFELVQYLVGLF